MSDSLDTLFSISPIRSIKLLVLGEEIATPPNVVQRICSLHIEHVSLGDLINREICRRSPLGQNAALAREHGTPVPSETAVALARRWFMARKPDAGFALLGFPATLLQARILDEWLEARAETLNAVLAPAPHLRHGPLPDYYRLQGLLLDTLDAFPALDPTPTRA